MIKRRRPSEEEERLWRRATQNTRPLRRRKAVVPPAAPRSSVAPAPAPPAAPISAAGPAGPRAPVGSPLEAPRKSRANTAGLDRRTAERLRRGQLAIEATLDLHGYRLEEARRALAGFIAAAQASDRRCVLIVTGKGTPGSKETIRALAPRWLAEGETSARVLAIAPARPKDGGDGALYVLLRKRKKKPAGGRQ